MEQKQQTKNRKRHLTPEFQVIRQSESNSKFFVASGPLGGSITSMINTGGNNSVSAW